MKSHCCILMSFAAFLCILFPCTAQNDLDGLLARLPFQTTQEGEEVAAALIALGPDAIQSVCGRLAVMGQGDDNAARYALSAMANYVMRDGAAGRSVLNNALTAALTAEPEPEIKTFLLERLAITGDDSVIDAIAPLLHDELLSDPAARVLAAVNSPKARDAVAAAIPGAQGKALLALVQAAGALHTEAAIPVLKPLLKSEDAIMRAAAMAAIAETGAAESEADIAGILSSLDFGPPHEALPLFLRYAERRLELADPAMCARLCGILLESSGQHKPAYETCGALSLLVRAQGEAALPDLIAAASNDNAEVRAAAFALADTITSREAAMQWEKALETARPEARPEIIRLLARTGDRAARNTVLAALRDPEPASRLAAIEMAPRFGGRRVVDGLLDVLREAKERDEIRAVQAALLQFSAADLAGPVGEALPALPDAGKKVALELLSARRAVSEKEAVFACVNDSEPDVRRKAIETLGNVAEGADLPRLIDLLIAASGERDVKAAQEALAAVATSIEDEAARMAPVVAALAGAQGEPRARLVAVLPELGSDAPLDSVIADTSSADAIVRAAALRSLADWPGLAARKPLLTLAAGLQEPAELELLLKGYARMVRESKRSDGKKLQWLEEGLVLARNAAQKRLFVNDLAALRSVGALRLFAALLDEPDLQKDVARLMVEIACPKDENDPGLRACAVATALSKALPFIEDEALRVKAATHIAAMPQPDAEGFVPLFNGEDLSGWTGDLSGYTVENGVLTCTPTTHANLYTDVDYADFVLRFEFRLTPGANNGLGIRSPLYGHAAYDGLELQILDDTAPENAGVEPYQYHGAIYGVAASERGHQRSLGEWNEEEVVARGSHITVVLNGVTILEVDLERFRNTPTPDGKEHPGLFNASGRIALLGHGARVDFRNIRIKELE